jgi:hypothetical protein
MNMTGQCLCGQVQYEAEVDPERVGICYCTDCQRSSASDYRVVAAVAGDSFRLSAGQVKSFVKTADSGNRRELAFCPECGTQLYGRPASGEGTYFSLRVGTVNQRSALSPKFQVWCASRNPWVALILGVPAYDTTIAAGKTKGSP